MPDPCKELVHLIEGEAGFVPQQDSKQGKGIEGTEGTGLIKVGWERPSTSVCSKTIEQLSDWRFRGSQTSLAAKTCCTHL